MNNGYRIRKMSDKKINDMLKHEIIYPFFIISDVRRTSNKMIAGLIKCIK